MGLLNVETMKMQCDWTWTGAWNRPPIGFILLPNGSNNFICRALNLLDRSTSHFTLNTCWVVLKFSSWELDFGMCVCVFFSTDLLLLSVLFWGFILEKNSSYPVGGKILGYSLPWGFNQAPVHPLEQRCTLHSFLCVLSDLMARICLVPFLLAQLHTPSICLARPIPCLRD